MADDPVQCSVSILNGTAFQTPNLPRHRSRFETYVIFTLCVVSLPLRLAPISLPLLVWLILRSLCKRPTPPAASNQSIHTSRFMHPHPATPMPAPSPFPNGTKNPPLSSTHYHDAVPPSKPLPPQSHISRHALKVSSPTCKQISRLLRLSWRRLKANFRSYMEPSMLRIARSSAWASWSLREEKRGCTRM
jgi:hypothetical protein